MPLPALPWTDNQLIAGDGVTYKFEQANNRLKIVKNDVTSAASGSIALSSITPDKTNFSATFNVNTPPGSTVAGQCVVVGSSPTGAFVGKTNHLEVWNGSSWLDVTPYEGLMIWDINANTLKAWDGTQWSPAVPATSIPPPASSITTAMLQDGAVTVQKANFKVISKSLTVAPAGASIGDAYIVAATPSAGDAWFGQAGKLAIKIGATNTVADWSFASLASGKVYWVAADNTLYGYSGSALTLIGPPADASLLAAKLADLSDLSVTQARNIVNAIDADLVIGGALLSLRTALGISAFGTAGAPAIGDFVSVSIHAAERAWYWSDVTGLKYASTDGTLADTTPFFKGSYVSPSIISTAGGVATGTMATVTGTFRGYGNPLMRRIA